MRIARIALCLAVLALVASACTPAAPASTQKTFAMVTDQNGLGDQGFNDSAWAGLQQAEKEFGAKPKVVESREQSQYVPNLTSLAEQKADLVVGVGYLLTDAIAEVSAKYPDVNFALVDSVVEAPNVANLVFKEQDGSFLMGAIAGLMTKTNVVGFVGGMEGDLIKKFEVGYRAGVKTTNPDCEVLVTYVGSFADPVKGEDYANAQYDQGADIVFQAAGQSGLGVINAAKKRNLYAIGADMDQNHLAPDNVINSMIKRVDTAVFETCKMVEEGTFKGGIHVYGIAEGGIDIAPTSEKTLPKDVLDTALALKERIKKGEFTPPSTEDEFNAFTPPSVQ
jgi:basic membrane protein A